MSEQVWSPRKSSLTISLNTLKGNIHQVPGPSQPTGLGLAIYTKLGKTAHCHEIKTHIMVLWFLAMLFKFLLE